MRTTLPPFVAVLFFTLPVTAQPGGDRRQPPAAPPKDASPLPPPPKADPKSEHKPLLPDRSLILERKPDGTARVLVAAEVCLREGPLEVFVCKRQTKEHEAILRVGMDARFIHAALIAAGAKVGTPVQYVNPKTEQPEYRPATGSTIDVLVHYTKDGKPHTHPAQEWIEDIRTKKPMAHRWVFAGSRFMKIPDDDIAPEYYCANNGDVIGISNSFDAMLDIPVAVSRDDASLLYQANTEMIPPLFTKVWVILEPSK